MPGMVAASLPLDPRNTQWNAPLVRKRGSPHDLNGRGPVDLEHI
jgi:hypothetical protein